MPTEHRVAVGIFGFVHRVAMIIIPKQWIFDFPIVLTLADRKLEVLPCDGIPVLVDHHDSKQIAECGEEEAVHVVLHALTHGVAETIENNLTDDQGDDTKNDMSERPALLQGHGDQEDLHADIDGDEESAEEKDHDKQANRIFRTETTQSLERQQRHGETDQEHDRRTSSQQPDRQRCSILIQLKADKSSNHQCGGGSGRKTELYGDKI